MSDTLIANARKHLSFYKLTLFTTGPGSILWAQAEESAYIIHTGGALSTGSQQTIVHQV